MWDSNHRIRASNEHDDLDWIPEFWSASYQAGFPKTLDGDKI